MHVKGKVFQFFGFSGMESQLKSLEFVDFEQGAQTDTRSVYQLIEVQTANLDIYMRSLKFF